MSNKHKGGGPSRHVYKSGAAGCGGKATTVTPKNAGQIIFCMYCERTFKQDGRYKEHLKNKHADEESQQTILDCHGSSASVSDSTVDSAQGLSKSSYPVKLPKSLLHEWCQKNKRPPPRFKHVEVKGGFRCQVVLPDIRRSESNIVLFYNGKPASTSQEAQHHASVVALHHIMGDRRLDRILPLEYREQWLDLEKVAESRRLSAQKHPKPLPRSLPSKELQSVFMSDQNRTMVEGIIMKENVDASNRNAALVTQSVGIGSFDNFNEGMRNGNGSSNDDGASEDNGPTSNLNLGNFYIQDNNFMQRHGNSKTASHNPSQNSTNILVEESQETIRYKLMDMGFKENFVTAALEKSHSLSEALDWLMLNVPENFLPFRFAPKSSKASVQVLLKTNKDHAEEFNLDDQMIQNLLDYGYDYHNCIAALSEANGNEDVALHKLFMKSIDNTSEEIMSINISKDETELIEMRSEELMALQSIFGEECFLLSLSLFKFSIELEELSEQPLQMELKVLPGNLYPFELPTVSFSNPKLNPKFLLELTVHVGERAVELIGSPMVYELFCLADEKAKSLATDYDMITKKEEIFSRERASSTCQSLETSKLSSDTASSRISSSQEHIGITTSRISSSQERIVVTDDNDATRYPKTSCNDSVSLQMKKEWISLKSSPVNADMYAARKKLPSFKERQSVLKAIKDFPVTVICGQTGCGKSTQVPQYLLEDFVDSGNGSTCNIICTEPRRVSAISLADRVAKERGESIGNTVGYSVRLENRLSSRTKILYCTTGIVLRRLLSDPHLRGVTHVVIDEVHERTLDGDMLLLLLREQLKRSENRFRLILMSATVKAESFAAYFENLHANGVAIINIPGFTYPVKEYFLEDVLEFTGYRINHKSLYKKKIQPSKELLKENDTGRKLHDTWHVNTERDQHSALSSSPYTQTTIQTLNLLDQSIVNYDLIASLILFICHQYSEESLRAKNMSELIFETKKYYTLDATVFEKTGSILVFLPGMAEIHRLERQLKSSLSSETGFWVLPLHGSMTGEDQRRVFEKAPIGHRKIILATNIAETSITIDDITCVIDTGRHKELTYDHDKGLSCLQETWISKANAKQRRGRAGRVQAGYCFRLYCKQQYQQLAEEQFPEILRVSLDRLCLQVKALIGESIQSVTERMLTPPSRDAVTTSLRGLQKINALDDQEFLTPLGRYLCRMPVDASVGKMLIFACILKCLHPILIVAAALSCRSPFLFPTDKHSESNASHLKFGGGTKSDHVAIVSAYEGWKIARTNGWKAEFEYCNTNFLSRENLVQMEASRLEYLKILADIGFCPYSEDTDSSSLTVEMNANSSNLRVVRSVICAGFYPKVIRVQHPQKTYIHIEGGTVPKEALAKDVKYFTKNDGRVFLHPTSVNFSQGFFDSPWLVYTEKVKTSKIFIKNSTMVPAYGLLLFGGKLEINHEKQTIRLDDWMEFAAPARISVLIKELRAKVNFLLEEKIRNPKLDISKHEVITGLIQLLVTDGF